MGKSRGGDTTKTSTTSSGNRSRARWKRALKRVNMKIARWERYKKDGKTPAKGSNRTGWDTAGLKKHAAFLQSLV